jgi:hypothetical protein
MKVTIIYPGRFEEPEVFDFPINSYSDMNNLAEVIDKLNYIYRQTNHVDGTEWIHGKKLRSMLVGDMVLIESYQNETVGFTKHLYVCTAVGWQEISNLVKTPEPWPKKS